MNRGYFKNNSYHNHLHIIDSLQALHYFLTVGELQNEVSKLDIFTIIVANIIHDFEHPGYLN